MAWIYIVLITLGLGMIGLALSPIGYVQVPTVQVADDSAGD